MKLFKLETNSIGDGKNIQTKLTSVIIIKTIKKENDYEIENEMVLDFFKLL